MSEVAPLAASFRQWLARQPAQHVEVIPGLLGGVIPYGGLSDPDVAPGAPITAGGYGEDRIEYDSKLFSSPCGEEPRTVHLGVDVFAPPETPVRAALSGKVHSFSDNKGPGNYGPVVIVEHEPEPGLAFHILYGHLARASLEGLVVGAGISAGDEIGRLGSRIVNGGWAPHLHFQIVLQIGAWRGDYPGVCARSEQDMWLENCPDPARLLGLAEG